MVRQGPRCSSRCPIPPRTGPIRNQREVEIEEQTQNCNPDSPPCQGRRQVGATRPGSRTRRGTGRSKKTSSGQATSQADVLSCAWTASMARGKPSGRAIIVPAVKTTNGVVAMLTSAFASPGQDGSERHTCTQGCDTEPDLDLVRNGRGYRQQIADEQERDDHEIDHQRPHGDLPMGKGLCQQLADRKPEAQPERVQDHEEHPEPVDQDDHTGLSCHSRSLLSSSSAFTVRRRC